MAPDVSYFLAISLRLSNKYEILGKKWKILKSIPSKSLGSKDQYPEKNALASFEQKSYVIELKISANELFTKWDLEIKTNGKRVTYDTIK